MSEIIVADDDAAIRMVLDRAFSREGHEVHVASNARALWRLVEEGRGDAVVSDIMMPDGNALDLLARIRNARPDLPVILMSAQNTFLTAVRASEEGAYDYLPKPFDLPALLGVVERALAQGARGAGGAPAEGSEDTPLVGRSPAMQEVYRVLARVMQTDLTVLIDGESGTGKELVAQALHGYGPRRRGPFVAVNMAAIPRDLIESELFGHVKGAFTGALAPSTGKFGQANGGTLFLDEIGDMPMEAQTRLLRVLQEGEFTAVGGRTPIATDARIVAATNRDLLALVERGEFRQDLYYRLNVVPLRLPPLRERAGDVQDLVRHFLSRGAAEGLPPKALDAEGMDLLRRHPWPGNVRELENVVMRLMALHPHAQIDAASVRDALRSDRGVARAEGGPAAGTVDIDAAIVSWLAETFRDAGDDLPAPGLHARVSERFERPLIQTALAATRGNQIRAAEVLGLNRNTLRKRIRDLGLEVTRAPRP